MDIVLKGKMDGIETARQIHSDSNIPVVYITAYTDDKLIARAKATEPFGYIIKPFKDRELKVAVEIGLYKAEMENQLKSLAKKLELINQNLQASRASFHNIVEKNTDGVVVVDEKGIVRFINPAAEVLLGKKAEDFLGKLFGFPVAAREMVEIDVIRNGAETGIGELRIAEIEWESEPAYLVSIRDITNRKQAEAVLKGVNEDLKATVEKLSLANRELQDLAHITNHDLKATLSGIKKVAEWIVEDYEDKLDKKGKEQIRLLLSRVDRMQNLIGGILQYSRIGYLEEKETSVNLNELVREVIDMVAPPENISITIEDKLPVIECKKTYVAQVFQNLLSNAVKYMNKPQGQIKVGCTSEDGFWKFGITDNGLGIEEKYFEKIFQIFQTLQPRDKLESTGIGLPVAKKIVELYHGKIWVESKPGYGSTFFFTLPKQKKGAKNAKLEANITC
jgi:signal transduction histidine kinase